MKRTLNFLMAACLGVCLAPPALHAQITGGNSVFKFLALSPSARATALGGMQIAVKDDDVALAALNPAALNPTMSGRLTFNHNFFLSDIQHGYAAYGWNMPKLKFSAHGGIQYMKYGDIKRADEYGNITGKITASETALLLGAARPLSDKLSVGLNLRLAFSTLDTYKSSAIAADAALMYADTARRFVLTAVLRNAGTQIKTFNGLREDLPFDLQVGFSKRLGHLPFRFSVIAHHLYTWDIRYNDPNAETDEVLLFGDTETKSSGGNGTIDNFFRHLVFNGEFLLGRNELFRIRLGYNHLLKRELSVRNYRSLAGFSGGVGLRISRFRIDVGYGSYHLAGGVVHVGIGTNLKDFF